MTDSSSTASVPHAPAIHHPRLRRIVRKLWRFTVATFALIGLFSLVHPFLFDLSVLASGSMAPTLQGDAKGGDLVLAEKITYWFRSPRRWEIVEFNDQEGIQIMKRVAALPGETIAVQNNRLLVNGSPINAPAGTAPVKYYPFGNLSAGNPHPVGDGFYVLGDDSIDSEDSRFEGSVSQKRIRARAVFILWPPNRIGWVR